jgi:hypothetical protein
MIIHLFCGGVATDVVVWCQKMLNGCSTGSDVGGSSYGLFKLLSKLLSGWIEENMKNLQTFAWRDRG